MSPNMEVATTVLLTYPTMLLFAAGYLLRWQDIPRYWIWCVINLLVTVFRSLIGPCQSFPAARIMLWPAPACDDRHPRRVSNVCSARSCLEDP